MRGWLVTGTDRPLALLLIVAATLIAVYDLLLLALNV